MRTMELTGKVVGELQTGTEVHRDLLAALSGRQADREGAVAHRTRRVVMASLGVMQEQKAGRKRSRAVAISSILIALLLLAPAIWRVVEDFISGERFGDVTIQFGLWFCFLALALVGAVLVAGWARHRA